MVLPSNKKKVKLIGTRAQSEENNLAYSYLGGGGGEGNEEDQKRKRTAENLMVGNNRVQLKSQGRQF